MNRRHNYREQIDACRPGSDDLLLPALAELRVAAENDRAVADELARSQRFDLAVSAAMHDLAVPTGLAERLLAKLSLGKSTEHGSLEFVVADATSAADETKSAGAVDDRVTRTAAANLPPKTKSRRLLIAGIGAISLSTLVAVGFWQLGSSAPRHISEAELSDAGTQWFRDAAGGEWQSATGPVQGFPIDRQAVVLPRKLAWKSLPLKSGEQAVAYNLTSSGKGRVLLFVVKTKNVYAVPTLPYKKLNGATGGVALAAWQSKGLLYVLAVDAREQRLEDVVRQPQITLLPRVPGVPSA